MNTSRREAVRHVLRRAFADAGWAKGAGAELDRLSERIASEKGVAQPPAGTLLSGDFLRKNGIDRERAVEVLEAWDRELTSASQPVAPSAQFSDIHISAPGGMVAFGNQAVSQTFNLSIPPGDEAALRAALTRIGMKDADVQAVMGIATDVKTEAERQMEISQPSSRIKRLGMRVSNAYLAAAIGVPAEVAIGLLVSALAKFWGIS
jgi:hypothetical protein